MNRRNHEGKRPMEHLESDLGTAAFLIVRGFPLLGLTPLSGGRFGFRFGDSEGTAHRAALSYLQGQCVPAKALVEAQKTLKTLLYTQKGNGNWKTKQSRPR